MKRKERIIAQIMMIAVIIATLTFGVAKAEASVKWENGINTGYWWGESGDINILKINGEASYCVEPDKIIESIDGYKEVEPTFTKAQWQRLILIAHFGYNKERKENADFAATQVMMWREIWKWKGFTPVSISDSNIPNLAGKINNIEEGITLYNKIMSTKPVFRSDQSPIEIVAERTYLLKDLNNVIGIFPYEIVKVPDGVEAFIDREKGGINIFAKRESVDLGKIVLRLNFSNSVLKNRFYYHGVSQNTATIGYIPELETDIDIKVDKNGRIKLLKKSETGKYIQGAVFQLKNLETLEVREYTTDEQGEFLTEDIIAGEYEVTEISVPEPYLLDERVKKIKIVPGETGEIAFENKMPTGEFTLTKYDKEKTTQLKGATYHIWSEGEDPEGITIGYDEMKTTGEDGKIKIEDMKMGSYFYQEIQSPTGYVKDDKVYEFQIEYKDMNTSHIKVEKEAINEKVVNEVKTVMGAKVKTSDDFPLKSLGVVSVFALFGTWIAMRSRKIK